MRTGDSEAASALGSDLRLDPTPFFSFARPLAVVAFGGNALLRPEDPGTTPNSSSARARPCASSSRSSGKGYELIVVHGNGPAGRATS